MIDVVESAVRRYRMLPPLSRVIVAVSGGPDSTCLLHVLRDLKVQIAGVAHVNHQLRGEESERDERFVVTLSNNMGLPCFVERAAVPVGGNLERELRQIRRCFFGRLIAEGKGTSVALGHTMDDQAETVLFRILRGAGTTGLAGILPVTGEGLIRPMLGVTREQVVEYLKDRGIEWRQDSSNESSEFDRNRLRHGLLPHLKAEWNPQLVKRLAHLAELSYEEEKDWACRVARAASAVATPFGNGVEVSVGGFEGMVPPLRQRLIRMFARKLSGRSLDFEHVRMVLELFEAEGSARVQVPGLIGTRSFEWVLLAPPGEREVPGAAAIDGPGRYCWGPVNLVLEREPAGKPCDTLKAEVATQQLELRGWQPGDRYRPCGSGRVRKLQELFQEAKIPSWRRPNWPILSTKDGHIVWTRTFGPAKEFHEDPRNSPLYVREEDA